MDYNLEPILREDQRYNFQGRVARVFNNSVIKLKLKRGVAIDWQSAYAEDERYGVYQDYDTGSIFSAYLTESDVEKQKNSYYKLQILQRTDPAFDYMRNKYSSCQLLQTFGEIGASRYIYNETKMKLCEAIREFESIFEELTGNSWAQRANFEKNVSKMNLLEIDYSPYHVVVGDEETSLLEPVYEMVKLMILSKLMRPPRMLTYDSRIWPMGRLSSRHIEKAFTVLYKLVGCITECDPGEIDQRTMIDLTNLYYSLVPRTLESGGSLRILNTLEAVKTELEYLYSLTTKLNTSFSINLLYNEFHYKLRPMNCDEAFYRILEMSVRNTGPAGLEVLEIFQVERHGENTQNLRFEDIQNKVLLWHGSPMWTLPEILTYGLFIGGISRNGRLGTGLYFSDMVKEALRYCKSWLTPEIRCLIVCEVDLEYKEVMERSDVFVETVNEGYNSVLGCGELVPDPKKNHVEFASDRALFPLGKPDRSPPAPNLYIIIAEIQNEQGCTEICLGDLFMGKKVRATPDPKWKTRQERLEAIANEYNNSPILEYLRKIAANENIS